MDKVRFGIFLTILVFFVGLAIALFSPTNILDIPFAQNWVDLGRSLFPTVRKMKGAHELAEVALLYFSTIWLLFPLIVFSAFLMLSRQKEKMLINSKINRVGSALFAGIIFPLAVILAISINYESLDSNDVRTYLIYQTRWGLGLFGFLVPMGTGALLSISLYWWLNVRQFFED